MQDLQHKPKKKIHTHKYADDQFRCTDTNWRLETNGERQLHRDRLLLLPIKCLVLNEWLSQIGIYSEAKCNASGAHTIYAEICTQLRCRCILHTHSDTYTRTHEMEMDGRIFYGWRMEVMAGDGRNIVRWIWHARADCWSTHPMIQMYHSHSTGIRCEKER